MLRLQYRVKARGAIGTKGRVILSELKAGPAKLQNFVGNLDPGLATISFSFFMKEGVPGMSFANAGGGSCENFILSIFLMTTKPQTMWCFVWKMAPNPIPRCTNKDRLLTKQNHRKKAKGRKS